MDKTGNKDLGMWVPTACREPCSSVSVVSMNVSGELQLKGYQEMWKALEGPLAGLQEARSPDRQTDRQLGCRSLLL